MTSFDPLHRPDCGEIILQKSYWSFSKSEFDIEKDLKVIIDLCSEKKKPFIHQILNSNLKPLLYYTRKQNENDLRIDSIFIEKLITAMQIFQMNESSKEEILSILMEHKLEDLKIDYIKYIKLIMELLKDSENFNLFKLISGIISKFFDIMEMTHFIDLIIEPMQQFSDQTLIQMVTTLCLFYLRSNKLNEIIEFNLLEKIIDLTLKAMESFPDNGFLQEHALLILNNKYILENTNFDRCKCIKLLLCSKYNFMNKDKAYEMCSAILKKMSENEILNIVLEDAHMEKLLNFVKNFYDDSDKYNCENIIEILSILTGFSSQICKSFVKNDGLDVFLTKWDVSTCNKTTYKLSLSLGV
jgi:hypothetical protein